MPDGKSQEGEPGRSNEVGRVAHKYGISSADARKLIKRFGNDPEKLYAAAETLKQCRAGWLPGPLAL
jgi:hypothetical protein